jgi:hypothetical protein
VNGDGVEAEMAVVAELEEGDGVAICGGGCGHCGGGRGRCSLPKRRWISKRNCSSLVIVLNPIVEP